MQNLFDAVENGNEYPEFRISAGWNHEKFTARLNAISQAIKGMIPQNEGSGREQNALPALIGLIEIENLSVLETLSGDFLSKQGYSWIAFSASEGSPIGLGVISRYPISDVRAHSITINGETSPRPILEIRIEPSGNPVGLPVGGPIVFLICHWKSKVGGDDATAPLRRASARVVHRRLSELKESEPGIAVIVMGDLNENHNEFSRRRSFSALFEDDPDAALMASASSLGGDFLVLSGERPPMAYYFDDGVYPLYSPWFYDIEEEGTYYYGESWETIDHFLLNENLFIGHGWEYLGSSVVKHYPFTSSQGIPNRYNPQSGRGLSDHLPLLLYLKTR